MNYQELLKEDFDAVVTGELTHYAIWLEEVLNNIICHWFQIPTMRLKCFKQFMLYRDGLTFQDKLEIVKGISSKFEEYYKNMNVKRLHSLLKRIEEFKSFRNTLVHGHDVSDCKDKRELKIQIVSRSGKERNIIITPESHEKMMTDIEGLLNEIRAFEKSLKSHANRNNI